ncbi:MAG: decarboxylating NADP(+)-dependent phosphogluconate dehydrogenase [Pseudomonadota bacterium]
MNETKARVGVIGMAVMGRNLALNILDQGFEVAVWNRTRKLTDAAVEESGYRLQGCRTLEEFVAAIDRPRRILVMIKVGRPVDLVLEQLREILDEGDIVIDGGNSWYMDTRRRERELAREGLQYFGVGISGGEEGARSGPAIMPGGSGPVYRYIQPILEAIAARSRHGPCVTWVGPDGAGHFVKMVHNGIEYADMQQIAEAYDLLRRLGGMSAPEIGAVFDRWNQGPMESFLVEISGRILALRDAGGGALVDRVLDKAGQKGTGRWTVQVALDLGIPVPSIAAATDARVLSWYKDERVHAASSLPGPVPTSGRDREALIGQVHDALHGAKICAYAQGFSLIQAASFKYDWGVNLGEIARIWTGGCIIRARFLDAVMDAFAAEPGLHNLVLAPQIRDRLVGVQDGWRAVLGAAQVAGIPVAGMGAGLAWYDTLRTADLPLNLTQAQRDAFGAHTYQRTDDPDGSFVHTDWLGTSD